MKAKMAGAFKFVVLTGILFVLYALDFTRLSLTEEARTAPAVLLLTAALHTAVLSHAIARARRGGWRLVGALFLAFYGTMVLMVAVEAIYLPEALPSAIVLPMLINGGIATALYAFIAVSVWGRFAQPAPERIPEQTPALSWYRWFGKFALIGLSWTILFVIFGALVFLPLAGWLAPEALAVYTSMDIPAWVLPFQFVRGILWAVLALPLLHLLRGSRWEAALTMGLLFAVLMGTNLLRATGLPLGLQMAHLVEVSGENLLFGWLVAWLVRRRQQ